MTNAEKEIQKNFYAYMENIFWAKISSDVFWYFLEYQNSTFTPTVLASIFSNMIKDNAFELAKEAEEMINNFNY